MVTTRKLLIDCGVAETRAALVFNTEVIRFYFGPARGDEHLPTPAGSGQLFLGRVRTVSKQLNGAFVDIGEPREAFLPVKPPQKIADEGESILVTVTRPAIRAKGAMISRDWRKDLSDEQRDQVEARASKLTPPARLGIFADAVMEALKIAKPGRIDEILISDSPSAHVLRRHLEHKSKDVTINVADLPFELFKAEDALFRSLDRIVSISGGGRMIIDEAEGVTVIDIDTGAAAGGATGRLNDKVNLAAAKMLFGELSRRAIGGRVVIDFLPPSNASARSNLVSVLKSSRQNLIDGRFGKITSDGLFDLTIPHRNYSLLERVSEPVGVSWLRPGRRFSLDWEAKGAVKALEQRLIAVRSSIIRLTVGAELAAYLDNRPQWNERIAARFGARFEIRCDPKQEGRRFVIAENQN